MKLTFKKLLTFGLVALVIGGILFTVAFIASGFDFDKMTGMEWEKKSFTETAEASSLRIDADSADVIIKYDENAEKISIAYSEATKRGDKLVKSFAITESGGKLSVTENTHWLYHLQLWSYTDIEIIITVPAGRVLSLDLSTDSGDINIIGNATMGDVRIDCDNGDVELRGTITAGKVTAETDNGDFEINGALTAQSFSLETDNGEVDFEGAININGVLAIEIDNGEVDAEEALITAQKIYISTDNADVEIKLFGAKEDYKISIDADNGKTNVNNSLVGERELYIETDNGDVYVYFSNN